MHMKIKTLRRALTELEDDIGRGRSRVSNQLNKVSMSTADAALEEGTSIVEHSVSRISLMIDMKFAIRGIISDFNESKGINIKTIEIAKLSLQNDFLEKVIIDRIQPPSTHYSYRERDPIQWKGGIEEDTNEKYRQTHRENKRKIQSLKDGCASINSSTVELTPELVTFLTDFKFV
jgi:hypothetical protein